MGADAPARRGQLEHSGECVDAAAGRRDASAPVVAAGGVGAPSSRRQRPLLVYYVTGHGFGHITRVAAITSEFVSRGWRACLCTALDERTVRSLFFRSEHVRVRACQLDVGCLQSDPLTVDASCTLRAYRARYASQRDRLIRREARFLREAAPSAVLSDVVPLSAPAARAAGERVYRRFAYVSNFFFSDIYSEYCGGDKAAAAADSEGDAWKAELVAEMAADECVAPRIVHLYPGRSALPHECGCLRRDEGHRLGGAPAQVYRAPLVARPRMRSRAAVRAQLGIPAEHARALLISLGGIAANAPMFELADVDLLRSPRGGDGQSGRSDGACRADAPWYLVVCFDGAAAAAAEEEKAAASSSSTIPLENARPARDDTRIRFVPRQQRYMPDLVAAADVSIGKLGYGTCAEALAYGTPLVYVRRALFREEAALARDMQRHGMGVELERADFAAGRWRNAVERAYAQPRQALDERDCANVGAAHVYQWVTSCAATAAATEPRQ